MFKNRKNAEEYKFEFTNRKYYKKGQKYKKFEIYKNILPSEKISKKEKEFK